MKKMISILLAFMLALLVLIPSLAEEETAGEPDFTGIWTDENFDRMELTILPSEVTWFDERMGEDSSADKYVIRMVWPSSESEESVYSIVAQLDETGTKLAYEGGMFAEYVYDENDDVDENETGLLEDNGTGFFTLSDDGSLYWHDSYLAEADNMTLKKEMAKAPSAEEILTSYYQLVIGLQPETAGASLKLAEAVRDIYVFCSVNPFWCMDTEAFSNNLEAAQKQLTAEQKAAFDQNRGGLTLEVTRLLSEDEELGGVYADAGVEDQMTELRNHPDVRLSVENFIFAVETLNEEP